MATVYEALPFVLRPDLAAALDKSWQDLFRPGTWWTGAERAEIVRQVRSARNQRAKPPWLREPLEPVTPLPGAAVEACARIAASAHDIDREWCGTIVDGLGDAPYVELVSIAVTVSAIDAFHEAVGLDQRELLAAAPGEPSRMRPDGVGDIGAHVPALVDYPGPNVGRALSLVPDGLKTFFRLVGTMYAMDDFHQMTWDHRPLPRPQVELLAARVSALNQCFY